MTPSDQQRTPKKPTHALHFKDNWDGEGDIRYLFAFEFDGVFYDFETGKPVIQYVGDEVLNGESGCVQPGFVNTRMLEK